MSREIGSLPTITVDDTHVYVNAVVRGSPFDRHVSIFSIEQNPENDPQQASILLKLAVLRTLGRAACGGFSNQFIQQEQIISDPEQEDLESLKVQQEMLTRIDGRTLVVDHNVPLREVFAALSRNEQFFNAVGIVYNSSS